MSWTKKLLILAVIVHLVHGKLLYRAGKTWNDHTVKHEPAEMVLTKAENGDLKIDITAKYFNNPTIENDGCMQGYPFDKLYNYEVVETFFLASESEKYTELEFSPCGAHLVLLLFTQRTDLAQYLPLDFSATVDPQNGTWSGTAIVPVSYLPPGVNKFNGYAIHGAVGDEEEFGYQGNVYEVVYVGEGVEAPDFHNLPSFGDIDLADIDISVPSEDSQLWSSLLNGQLYYKLADSTEVWMSADLERKTLTVRARMETSPDAVSSGCARLSEPEEEEIGHDEQQGVQLYFFSPDYKYLQLLLGNTGAPPQIDADCVSATLLWGPDNVLDRRLGSSGNDFEYSAETSSVADMLIWDASLTISWDYLPPQVQSIQVLSRRMNDSPYFLFNYNEEEGSAVHNMSRAALVDRRYVVDPEYNSDPSSIWEEATKPSTTIPIVVGSIFGALTLVVAVGLVIARFKLNK